MELALQIVLIISSVLLVLLILLHRGRGGGLSSLFGGGVQSSLSGSSVVEKNLDRLTLFVGAIWVIAIIGTGLLVEGRGLRRQWRWPAATRSVAPAWGPVRWVSPSGGRPRRARASRTSARTGTSPPRRSPPRQTFPSCGTARAVGCPAGRDGENPPAPPRTEPYKTHLAYVKERRSDADGAAILEEALSRLRASREL